jgi:hypothetical protein
MKNLPLTIPRLLLLLLAAISLCMAFDTILTTNRSLLYEIFQTTLYAGITLVLLGEGLKDQVRLPRLPARIVAAGLVVLVLAYLVLSAYFLRETESTFKHVLGILLIVALVPSSVAAIWRAYEKSKCSPAV